jgi:glycosyltransferase involved in cell wall biosynthesis
VLGSSAKVRVVNPAIGARFRPSRDRATGGTTNIGYLSNLDSNRRLDKALRIVSELARMKLKVRFQIRGGGKGRLKLWEYARSLGVQDSVTFLDYIPEERLPEFYNQLDLFLFPVNYEGFGYPILEAQACGVPVILFKDAEISPEVSKQALVAKDEGEAASLAYTLATNPEYHSRVSKVSADYASSFTLARMGAETKKLYDGIV